MAVYIGHASQNEYGTYATGKAGDQTKKEVCTRLWYNRPWTFVIRANDDSMREKIAYAMERACLNDKIGYAQNTRNTLLTLARKFNYDPGLVNSVCNTDCSALVSVCCIYAGIPESTLYIGGNLATTSTLRKRLFSTGKFVVYSSSNYTNKTNYLKRGDILLCEGHHVAVVLNNGPDIAEKIVAQPILRKGMKNVQVKYLQQNLNEVINANLVVDGDFGNNTYNALIKFQTKYKSKLVVDGIYGSKTYAKMKELLV